MAYSKYTNLKGANAVLAKMADFALASGWVIIENMIDDKAIDGSGTVDGKKLAIRNSKSSVWANFRSANGAEIFGTGAKDQNLFHGIGLTCSESHTNNPASGKWFDQPGAPVDYNSGAVVGVGIPVNPTVNYTLYANVITKPTDLLVFSITQDDKQFWHLAVGELEKVGNWDGGAVFSGSRNALNMFPTDWTPVNMEADDKPLFSVSEVPNTYLRIDVDNAPNRQKPVTWASAGNTKTGYTGKQMSLPVKAFDARGVDWDAKIPDYTKIQSENPEDHGRNVNTLNCVSVNLNLVVYVLRDPDALRNFSPVGYVPGVYFVSMRNVAPAQTYEISYPTSGQLHQTFPYTRRRGVYGMDGFSVKQ